jgi:hypothetical protein
MRPVENDDPGLLAIERRVLRILARDVAVYGSIAALRTFQKHGNVGDPQRRRDRHQIDERKLVHEVMEEAAVVHQLRFGDVERFGGRGLRLGIQAGQSEASKEIAAFHSIIVAQNPNVGEKDEEPDCYAPRGTQRVRSNLYYRRKSAYPLRKNTNGSPSPTLAPTTSPINAR